jgi:hypothetical protein
VLLLRLLSLTQDGQDGQSQAGACHLAVCAKMEDQMAENLMDD